MPLLWEAFRCTGKLILSTGMSTLEEVENALDLLNYAALNDEPPSFFGEWKGFYHAHEGAKNLGGKLILLHCLSQYPAPVEQINLRAIQTIKTAFGLPVGYSDHTEGIWAPSIAVALGAEVIEKHFTLDKQLPGPDHKASLEPKELSEMIQGIRLAERCLGDGIKRVQESEKPVCMAVRKSLVASTQIEQGKEFHTHNLSIKRPGTGISPAYYWDFLSKKSNYHYEADTLLKEQLPS